MSEDVEIQDLAAREAAAKAAEYEHGWSADIETGDVVRVDQTSTENDGIYGWMLENTFNGGLRLSSR